MRQYVHGAASERLGTRQQSTVATGRGTGNTKWGWVIFWGVVVALVLWEFAVMQGQNEAREVREAETLKIQTEAAIQNHEFVIGMTGAQVVKSIGRPAHINRTVSARGESEQWVYEFSRKTVYLYFEDGTLTSFQD